MKYISFWEYKAEDAPKVLEKFINRNKLGLKTLYGPCHISLETKGFKIFETEDSKILDDYATYYQPELSVKIYPINDSSEVIESWQKHHRELGIT